MADVGALGAHVGRVDDSAPKERLSHVPNGHTLLRVASCGNQVSERGVNIKVKVKVKVKVDIKANVHAKVKVKVRVHAKVELEIKVKVEAEVQELETEKNTEGKKGRKEGRKEKRGRDSERVSSASVYRYVLVHKMPVSYTHLTLPTILLV